VERDIDLHSHWQQTVVWSGMETEQTYAIWTLLAIENLERGVEEEGVLVVEHIGQHLVMVLIDSLSGCTHVVPDLLEIVVDPYSWAVAMRLAPPS
jgi:hypothetical protein